MEKIFLLNLIGLILISNCSSSPKEGTTLYLNRLNVETKRAVFEYAEDCRLIADAISKTEPRVKWYCK